MIRQMLVELLRQERCEVLAAADGQQALEASRKYPEPIHLLVTDILMPGMGGIELLLRMRQERPELRVLVISGHGDGEDLPDGVELLTKPFPTAAFRKKVRELLSR